MIGATLVGLVIGLVTLAALLRPNRGPWDDERRIDPLMPRARVLAVLACSDRSLPAPIRCPRNAAGQKPLGVRVPPLRPRNDGLFGPSSLRRCRGLFHGVMV